jgi:DNA invertase Pin-like site-specific DNA recombinase
MPVYKRKVVGYVRVSTTQQEEASSSLGTQREAIHEWARRNGHNLLGIFEDVGSARADGNLFRRHDLQAAIEHANREGAVLVVTRLDRLSRNTKDATRLAVEIKKGVVSIADEHPRAGLRKTEIILKEVGVAQQEAEQRAKATAEGLKSVAATGKKLGSPSAGRRSAAIASAKVRKINADIAVEKIAKVLAESEANRNLTARELMELLNNRKIRSGSGREWTLEGLRVPKRKAERLLLEQAELDAEEDDGPFTAATLRTDDFVVPAPAGGRACGEVRGTIAKPGRDGAEEGVDEAEAERSHYAKNPLYGMF